MRQHLTMRPVFKSYKSERAPEDIFANLNFLS